MCLTTLCEAIDALPARDVALVVDGVAVGGAELDLRARVHAARVLALGIERAALMAPTSVELIAALIAHLRLGIAHVPINTRYQPPEVAHVLADSGASALTLAPAGSDAGASEPLAAWPAPPSPDTTGLIVYTSGTTGKPKGVVLSQRALAASLGAMMRLWGITAADVVVHALPLFHVHGLGLGLLGPLLAGARVEVHAKFAPAAIVGAFAPTRGAPAASVLMGVPTMYHALLEHLDATPADGAILARGRLFTAGSAALPAALLERFRAHTGQVILERYGMTETLFTLSNPLAGERRAGTVGLPVPGVEVRLADDDGAIISASEVAGEIEVRAPGLMDGYWGRPDATAATFRDGWFKTGDVATVDPDGYYRIVGRRSTDIIKSGGFKIGAREIEDVLARHPAVAEVAVIGVPDERWGEVVAAAIVAKDPAADPARLAAELVAWSASELADFKRPRRVVVLTELPRNALGKVTKPALREHF